MHYVETLCTDINWIALIKVISFVPEQEELLSVNTIIHIRGSLCLFYIILSSSWSMSPGPYNTVNIVVIIVQHGQCCCHHRTTQSILLSSSYNTVNIVVIIVELVIRAVQHSQYCCHHRATRSIGGL